MKTEILTKPFELREAWSEQYGRLARVFADMLGNNVRVTAEIGCGSGALTIPLAKLASRLQFVLVDRFADTIHGSYSRSYRALRSNLKEEKLIERARVVVFDYLKWVKAQNDQTYDAVISCEFLPEITSAETKRFIRECYRLLKRGGVSVHSFLLPVPRNIGQKLLITADSNPRWTNTPPKEWFSPKPDLIIKEFRKSGFERIRRVTIRSHLVMKGDAAKSWLRRRNQR